MQGTKNALQSVTIWGVLMVFIAPIINKFFGVEIDQALEMEIAQLLTEAAQLVGAAIAAYGRIRAKQKISIGKANLLVFLVGSSLVLTSCATTSEKDCLTNVAAAEQVILQKYNTAFSLLLAEIISPSEAKTALKIADAANAAANSARKLCPVDEREAQDYLLEAGRLLIEFNKVLGS